MAKKKSPKAVMEERITSDNGLNFSSALPTDRTTLHSMLEALTHFIDITRTNFQENADGACSKLIESVNELTTGCEPSSHLPKISAKPGLYIASNFVDKAILSNAVKKLQTASGKVH